FFFSSRRRHTISTRDWSSDVCSSDLMVVAMVAVVPGKVLERDIVVRAVLDLLAGVLIVVPAVALDDVARAAKQIQPVGLPHRGRSEERRVGKEGRCGVVGW